jgi:hypothetical protein
MLVQLSAAAGLIAATVAIQALFMSAFTTVGYGDIVLGHERRQLATF